LYVCTIVAVPIIIISGVVIIAFNNDTIYETGFIRYQIPDRTGISPDHLSIVSSELQGYFNDNEKFLSITTFIDGEPTELFNEREIEHMKDVKDLVQAIYWIFTISGLYLAITSIISILPRYAYWKLILQLLFYGSLLTIGIITLFGLAALSGFDDLFLKFHQLSFSNDLWQLDPRTDYLIMMFPTEFWFDSAIEVALTALYGAAIITSLTGSFFVYNKLMSKYHGTHRN